MMQSNRTHTLLFVLLAAAVAVLFLLDLCVGTVWVSPRAVWQSLAGRVSDGGWMVQIVRDIRLPKALVAVLAGAALSVSGSMMQTLFRNPLAGPYILGVSSGASLGVALVTMCAAMLPGVVLSSAIVPAAVLGSAVVLALVMLVSRYVRDNVSLLIVGMMFGSIAGALVNLVQNFANPDALKLFIVWTFGSLGSVGWNEMPVLIGVLAAGFLLTLLAVKPMNGLLLGEDYARSLGIRVEYVRLLLVAATGLLAGGVTAYCGPIAFVGVAVPHIARGLTGSANHRLLLPASALVGAALLLLCDILCSLFTYPLPVSTVSALFGAPVIVWIILRRRR